MTKVVLPGQNTAGQPNGYAALDGNSGLLVPAYLEATQQSTAPAAPAAGKTRLYVDSSGLLQLLPAAGAQRRIPVDLGSGTALPSSGMVAGDTYQHNALGRFVYGSGGWRQIVVPAVADATTRASLATTYGPTIATGVRVRQTDTGNTWEWNATTSKWVAVPDHTFPVAAVRQATTQTGLVTGWQVLAMDTVDQDSAAGWTANAGNGYGGWKCPAGQDGLYAVEGAALLSVAVNNLYNARIIKNNTTIPASYGTSSAAQATAPLAVSTGRHLLTLASGDYVQIQAYCNAAYATTVYPDGSSWLAVERIR